MWPGSPLRQRWQTRPGPGLKIGRIPGLSCSVCGSWLVRFEPSHVSIGQSSIRSTPIHTRLDVQKSHGSSSRPLFFRSFTHCIFTSEAQDIAKEANKANGKISNEVADSQLRPSSTEESVLERSAGLVSVDQDPRVFFTFYLNKHAVQINPGGISSMCVALVKMIHNSGLDLAHPY